MLIKNHFFQPLMGTRHEVTFDPYLSEVTLETPILLPATEPATPQLSFTYTKAAYGPTVVGCSEYKRTFVIYLLYRDVGGTTVSCVVKKNTSTISSGSYPAVTAGHYATLQLRAIGLLDLNDGDVIDIYLYATGTATYLEHYVLLGFMTQPFLSGKRQNVIVNAEITCSLGVDFTLLEYYASINPYFYNAALNDDAHIFTPTIPESYLLGWCPNITYGLTRSYSQDIGLTNTQYTDAARYEAYDETILRKVVYYPAHHTFYNKKL